MVAGTLQLGPKRRPSGRNFHYALAGAHRLTRQVMARPGARLNPVLDEVLLILGIPPDRPPRLLIAVDRPKDVLRVAQPVHIADLGAVERGNRYLADPEALVVQLDDDLRVEVEVIGHVRQVYFPQGVQA